MSDSNRIPETIADVEELAARHGVSFRKSDYSAAERSRSAAHERLAAVAADAAPAGDDWLSRWNRAYPELLRGVSAAGSVALSFAVTAAEAFGVPIMVIVLLVVEHSRVKHGMMLFESSESLASFGAWALVVGAAVFEVVAHYIEYSQGYKTERGSVWSLKIAAKNLAYRLGVGTDWQERKKSPAAWAHSVLRVVTFAILALAVAGSMADVIASKSGAWYTALWSILVDSSLSEMTTWLGGLLFAVAAVLMAQRGMRYVAIKAAAAIASVTGSDDGSQAEAEAAAARALYARMLDQLPDDDINPTQAPKRGAMAPAPASSNGTH